MDKYKTIFEERLERHNHRMQETVEEDMVELTRALFEETFDKLKKKPGDKYKFITMAGESLKVALFHLCMEKRINTKRMVRIYSNTVEKS